MKRCSKCRRHKDKVEFYKNRTKLDGLEYQCKECSYERNIKRADYLRTHRREKKDLYRRGWLKWLEKNRDQYNSNQKAAYHVRVGNIQKLACDSCSNPDTEMHHKDYSKPLEVVWLCKQHHGETHRRNLFKN